MRGAQWLVVVAVVLLGGCAAVPPHDEVASAPVAAFQLLGRLSVRQDDKGVSGNLRWRHAGMSDDIALASPLGQTLAEITSDADGARLVTADRLVYRATSIEALVRQGLGWELPLKGLRYWIFGATIPGVPLDAAQRDHTGRLERFTQDQWRVAILAWAPPERGGHPSRLQLNFGNSVDVRLAIDELRTD